MSKINKTTNYHLFKFRDDNRATIKQGHVKNLIESIKTRDLTEYKPITINEDFEILDGQHRFLACKKLNLPIYYQITEDATPKDLISLNVNLPWNVKDYFNYWCKQHSPEYLKLEKYLKENNCHLSSYLSFYNKSKRFRDDFKNGKYIHDSSIDEKIQIYEDTKQIINKYSTMMAKDKYFIDSNRFCIGLGHLIALPGFDKERWKNQLTRYSDFVTIKPTVDLYYRTFLKIYNYNQKTKLGVSDDET